MGHFGRRPIKLAWFTLVLPALLLNYFGQGALLIAEHEAVDSPFFNLAPSWLLYPLVALATAATIIASQALISGVFSLTLQAIQLGYAPRHRVNHTSATAMGQIYLPAINWGLMAACITLVIGFGSSTDLAAAYGVAVTSTMLITTVLFYVVLREKFGWPLGRAAGLCGIFLVIDAAFLGANVFKIPAGGWFPLLVGLVLLVQMATWRQGRQLVAERIHRGELAAADLLDDTPDVTTVPGTAIFLFKDPGKAPPALINNLRHNEVRHAETYTVAVEVTDAPHVDGDGRVTVATVRPGLHQVVLRVGYLDELDVPAELAQVNHGDGPIDDGTATYFVGREYVVPRTLKEPLP
jgi:KUP system potassium uptake protein